MEYIYIVHMVYQVWMAPLPLDPARLVPSPERGLWYIYTSYIYNHDMKESMFIRVNMCTYEYLHLFIVYHMYLLA